MASTIFAAKVEDLQDQQVKEVDIEDVGKILVYREGNEFFASASKCPHYGLPLKSGIYSHGRVRCHFHGACFSVKTGDIEDYPSLAALEVFQTEVVDGSVYVKYDPEKVKSFRRPLGTCKKSEEDKRVFVLVGGGPAATLCAATLRDEGFKGEIVLLSREKYLPTDRIKLSKMLTATPEQIQLYPPEWFEQQQIQVHLDTEVTGIDTEKSEVTTQNQKVFKYDKLLLATGGDPRKLTVPGSELGNIYSLREVHQANQINDAVNEKVNAVIIGSSFIGMEIAATLTGKVNSVTIVGRGLPFEKSLGTQIGSLFKSLHESKGVKFVPKATKEFKGTDGKVSSIVFTDGSELPADLVVLGIGVSPATSFVPSTISKHTDGGVLVDEFFRTSAPNVYAAGDIAKFKYLETGSQVRIEHWSVASAQGALVAKNMLHEQQKTFTTVPYFWCLVFGKSVRFCGYAPEYDDLIFHADEKDPFNCVAYYCLKGKVLGVASISSTPVTSTAAEVFARGKMPSADVVRSPDFKLSDFL